MAAWAKALGIPEGSKVKMVADTQSDVTSALGMAITHPGPGSVLGHQTKRCKRFAIYVDDGTIKVINVSEGPEDPAGDGNPSASCVEGMLESIKKC
eukprot:NODE_2223_length_742_cov_318.298701_g1794_i0.p2 GENE.NODE_2223_length_742_cov_318.298701_g1794_i0~~NODE_2223_length_742_cov_318.298701_g1794_i0.p2  ORF type:complete len:96 (+),score=29.74 NODE_2223_length_742_cov_318.298701_g1794_i0:227-514(+)